MILLTMGFSSSTSTAPLDSARPGCPVLPRRAAALGLPAGLPLNSVPVACSWIALARPRIAAVAGVECGAVGTAIVVTTILASTRLAIGTDAVVLSRRPTPYSMRPLRAAVVYWESGLT